MGQASPMGPAAGRTTLISAAIASLGLMLTAAHAASNKPAGCLIEPEQVADVGSPVTGVIEDLPVALGDKVEAGQALVRLRADVERANANVAVLRAQVDAEVKAAQTNLDVARQKVVRTEQLVGQSFVSTQALEQAQGEAEVAAQKLKLAQSQQKIYAREESVAQAQLGLRTLRSPIKGIVVERYNNVGERVEERPVVRVAAIDPLRVSLMVPIAQYGQIAVGSTLVIRPELPGATPVQATVKYVDMVVDAASNSFRVRLSLPNPGNRLPGGLRCKAELNAQAGSPAAAPTAPASPVSPAPAVRQSSTGPLPAAASVAMATSTAMAAPLPTRERSSPRVPGMVNTLAMVRFPVRLAAAMAAWPTHRDPVELRTSSDLTLPHALQIVLQSVKPAPTVVAGPPDRTPPDRIPADHNAPAAASPANTDGPTPRLNPSLTLASAH